jgi:hypothetical protein
MSASVLLRYLALNDSRNGVILRPYRSGEYVPVSSNECARRQVNREVGAKCAKKKRDGDEPPLRFNDTRVEVAAL